MATTGVIPVQTIWDCRWSRPGYRITGIEDHLQPESPWVCVRLGDRRNISDEECGTCVHWEELPASRSH